MKTRLHISLATGAATTYVRMPPPPCDCQARFDRLAAHPTATAADQLSAALLEMVAIKRAARCGCLAAAPAGPTAADIFGLCAAAARQGR